MTTLADIKTAREQCKGDWRGFAVYHQYASAEIAELRALCASLESQLATRDARIDVLEAELAHVIQCHEDSLRVNETLRAQAVPQEDWTALLDVLISVCDQYDGGPPVHEIDIDGEQGAFMGYCVKLVDEHEETMYRLLNKYRPVPQPAAPTPTSEGTT